jgi:hypothetical protein
MARRCSDGSDWTAAPPKMGLPSVCCSNHSMAWLMIEIVVS